jgi:hypothetical protein
VISVQSARRRAASFFECEAVATRGFDSAAKAALASP